MQTVSYTALRVSLAQTLDKVNVTHEPVIVTCKNGEPAVLMSLEDFRSYEAPLTLWLTRRTLGILIERSNRLQRLLR